MSNIRTPFNSEAVSTALAILGDPDKVADALEDDTFKRCFATIFVSNNGNWEATLAALDLHLPGAPVYVNRSTMLGDLTTARYVREEMARRKDDFFITDIDVLSVVWEDASNPESTPNQRHLGQKLLAEMLGMIGSGRQAAQDVASTGGVTVQVASFAAPPPDPAKPEVPVYVEADPVREEAMSPVTAIAPVSSRELRGKAETAEDVEFTHMMDDDREEMARQADEVNRVVTAEEII